MRARRAIGTLLLAAGLLWVCGGLLLVAYHLHLSPVDPATAVRSGALVLLIALLGLSAPGAGLAVIGTALLRRRPNATAAAERPLTSIALSSALWGAIGAATLVCVSLLLSAAAGVVAGIEPGPWVDVVAWIAGAAGGLLGAWVGAG